MLAPLPAELRGRLDQFERAFALCREGGLSLARLLALPVERLRLARLQSGARAVAPVTIAAEAEAHLDATWPAARVDSELKPPAESAAVRRFLAFARQDADLDPRAVSTWLEGPADALLVAFTRTRRRALAEVGRGPGGEATAYLLHLLLLRAMRAAHERSLAASAYALLVHLVFGLSARGVAESESSAVDELPLRLGLQLALTASPPALGVRAEALSERAVNGYRTHAAAVALVQRVVRDPVESIPLERVMETVARRLVVDSEFSRALLVDALLERVRDAALLAFVQTHRRHDLDAAPPLLEVLSSSRALTQTVMVAHRRRALLDWTGDETRGSRAAQALSELLKGAEAVVEGDSRPLGVSWKLEERAALAARGALLLVLESHVHGLVRDLGGVMEEVRGEEGHARWRAGRAYRLAFDGAPLHHLPSSDREAIVYVHLGDARALLGASLAEGIWKLIHAPILEAHAQIAGERQSPAPPGEVATAPRTSNLEVLSLSDEALVFAGSPVEVMQLAAAARVIVDRARAAARAARPDVLGGAPESRVDADDELARIRRRLFEVDEAAGRASGPGDAALLADGRAVLEERLAALERVHGPSELSEPAAGIFVAYGPRAERVGWSGGQVALGSVLDAARRGARGDLSPWGDEQPELEPLHGTSRTQAGGWDPPGIEDAEERAGRVAPTKALSDPMDSAPLRSSLARARRAANPSIEALGDPMDSARLRRSLGRDQQDARSSGGTVPRASERSPPSKGAASTSSSSLPLDRTGSGAGAAGQSYVSGSGQNDRPTLPPPAHGSRRFVAARVVAVTEENSIRLVNRGCALSDAALRAWCAACGGLVELVEELVPGERRIEARRAGARVATFRWVERVGGEDVWELLDPEVMLASPNEAPSK